MQTKHQVQQLLASAGVGPNKKLGQNFLIDLNLIRYLLDQAAITKDDLVLEVGCGTGSMTEGIAERAGGVIVVEYDRVLGKIAQARLADQEHVTIIHGDALKNKNAINEEAAKLIEKRKADFGGRFMLVANLPYNIAASLMANLIVNEPFVDAMYVTIQKEVALRMSAKPGDNLYGILSIIMEAAGNVRFMKKLPQSVFWPAPKVESAMVEFVRDEEKISKIRNLQILKEVVSLFMGHRRKMIKACTKFASGSLSDIKDWSEIFAQSEVDPTKRSEKIAANDFVNIANICAEKLAD